MGKNDLNRPEEKFSVTPKRTTAADQNLEFDFEAFYFKDLPKFLDQKPKLLETDKKLLKHLCKRIQNDWALKTFKDGILYAVLAASVLSIVFYRYILAPVYAAVFITLICIFQRFWKNILWKYFIERRIGLIKQSFLSSGEEQQS